MSGGAFARTLERLRTPAARTPLRIMLRPLAPRAPWQCARPHSPAETEMASFPGFSLWDPIPNDARHLVVCDIDRLALRAALCGHLRAVRALSRRKKRPCPEPCKFSVS